MGYIELFIYIGVAFLILILLIVVLFDKKEYAGNPVNSFDDFYIFQEIRDDDLQEILFSMKSYQKPLFLNLYYYLKTFPELILVEKGSTIEVYSKKLLLFKIKFNNKAIIFQSKFKGIVYPESFVIRGSRIEGHIYNELNLNDAKAAIFNLVNTVRTYDFSKGTYGNKKTKKIRRVKER